MFHTPRLFLVSALVLSLIGAGSVARAAVPNPVTAEAVAKQIDTQLRGCLDFDGLKVTVVPCDDKACAGQGHFQTIEVTCDAARVQQFAFRDFHVKASDVTLDLDKLFADKPAVKRLPGGGQTTICGKVLEADMNALLKDNHSAWIRNSGLKNMTVKFTEGAITFAGDAKQLLGAHVEVTGGIKVHDASLMDFVPTGAKVNEIPVPIVLVKDLLSKFNPLYNFADLPLSPTIETVTISTGYILVQG
jgi:hypothetical protein